ncbi:MAG TPA: efflux RND transporter periplasmic adaptor subunit, partial [Planctomycetota bacterium]|nr:efflux RND transporter periplasmic adaptor subunit [Planctomycetota bacterium]
MTLGCVESMMSEVLLHHRLYAGVGPTAPAAVRSGGSDRRVRSGDRLSPAAPRTSRLDMDVPRERAYPRTGGPSRVAFGYSRVARSRTVRRFRTDPVTRSLHAVALRFNLLGLSNEPDQSSPSVVDSADLSRLRISRETPGGGSSRSSRMLVYIGLGALLIVLIAIGARFLATDRPVEVRTAVAEARGGAAGGSGGLTANGYVVARTKASVSSKLPGRLAFLGVEEGDRVREGDIIARLESAEFEAAVRQAESEITAAEATRHEADASVAQAERALARAKELHAATLIAKQQLEDAETGVEVARARQRAALARVEAARQGLRAAQANFENTRVRAPFSGTVLRKDAEVGEVVAPSVGGGLTRGAVVTMADLSTLEVEVDVNEAYISRIRSGAPARITLDAYPDTSFRGEVRQVVPTADR